MNRSPALGVLVGGIGVLITGCAIDGDVDSALVVPCEFVDEFVALGDVATAAAGVVTVTCDTSSIVVPVLVGRAENGQPRSWGVEAKPVEVGSLCHGDLVVWAETESRVASAEDLIDVAINRLTCS